MSLKNRKFLISHFALVLALLGGMFGAVSPQQVLAAPGDLARISVGSDSTQANEDSDSASI
ncbi:MAG TPA: hypothetical protein VJ821_01325, partial [Anaerolineales bacterium]|nr:hypothetical protein [Anaerolineales bacterium]